jgi:hypothetical protein
MAEEDVDWGMDEDFDPWQGAEEQASGSVAAPPMNVESSHRDGTSDHPHDIAARSYSSLLAITARTSQEQGFHSGSVGKVEGTTESQQRVNIHLLSTS